MASKIKVRDVLKRLNDEGWKLITTRGSHRQFKHPTLPGKVTVNGHLGDDIPITILKYIYQQAGWGKP